MRRSAEMQGARSCAVRFLLLSCCVFAAAGYPFRTPLDLDVTPRVTVLNSGLQGCRRFQSSAVSYSTMLLEADGEHLFVGARGAVFALNASDISASSALTIEWEASPEQKRQCLLKGKDNETECFNHIRFLQRFNSTHLYMCGTHAFRPLCAYINEEEFVMSSQPEEGKDKCPYSPTTGYTALIIDQQVYTASQYEFRSFPDIRRNSPSPTLKTEDAPTRWVNEADFVGSALVRESLGSSTGDDDKIYYFFTERSQEQTTTYSHSRVARVARVCKGDRGGRLTLQKRWTSFLKARLTCSLPEYDFHFNMLRSMFVMPGLTPQDTLFYGIFGLEWKNVKASAVCRFSLSEVQEAFQGPYMENQDSGSKWKEYTGKIPDPRPGTCITDALRARGINVSTSLPDDVLNFVRRHPLMSREVQPSDRRPLLFRRTTDYTHMAVNTMQGLDGRTYHVLYMGTDDGWLHKAVEIDGQLHIIEELQLFKEPQPVNNLLLSAKQMSVYVSSPSGVVQLPLSSCHRYTSCYDCIFARDPHCAWNGAQCVDVMAQADSSTLIQDIQQGSRGCENTQDGTQKSHLQLDVVVRSRSVRVGDDVLLQCELSSNLATPLWTLDGSELQGYGLNSGFRTGTDGLLIIEARQDQSGLYTCFAVENNIKVAIVTFNVTIRLDLPPPPPVEPTEDPYSFFSTLPASTEHPSPERPLSPASLLPHSELLSPRNMEAMYLSLITILGGLCVVLTVVLVYVGFCLRVGNRGKYSLRAAASAYPNSKRHNRNRKQHRSSSHMELKTISSHCNGNGICNGVSKHHNGDIQDGGFLQIVPGEANTSPNKEPPPPAPPLPPTPHHDFPNGLSATLPSVLRRMNGNSYVLLRQSESESTPSHGYSFAEELNKILEKRKHTQLLPRPDESSV
ncbi:semaphorin-4G-like isoform X1 [Anoplopoma fimbria]|uniref:semaphorin-4G-like isoform X1 n=1 Tax=Anoplopoma fimbria TaxID=229290 RepID=UPI0023ECEF4D|nr:semaphorin-4G-like isoform X1 [Anoplopoma fimbria]XP_054456417.1 semaphorin-4G-like isoform X1 [Anoplopoma fimbria]